MPSVFSRRRGSTGQVHNAPVSSSAAIAASSAFLKNTQSGATLSSAAAAAALRSHTTTPEPIANVQTKRMVRRGSNSSNGSAPAIPRPASAPGRRPMQRRDSSSSMTERTFRSPSPGNRESPHRPRPAASDAPPVPRLSADFQAQAKNGKGQSARGRTSNINAKPLPPINTARDDNDQRARDLSRDSALRSSVNFSRPIASPTETPPLSPTRPKTAGSWFSGPNKTGAAPRQAVTDRPRTSSGPTSSQLTGIESALQSVASTTPKKKKRTTPPREGAALADKTLSSAPRVTAVNPATAPLPRSNADAPANAQLDNTEPSPRLQKKRADREPSTIEDSAGSEPPSDQDVPTRSSRKATSDSNGSRRASGLLQKQPSVVMEVPEPEAGGDGSIREGPYPRARKGKLAPTEDVEGPPPRSRVSTASPRVSMAGSPMQRPRPASLEVPDSAAKSAHFANLTVDDTPGQRHNPPPRSVSPAKSALKHSPSSSIRTNSPVATFSPPTSKPPGSDTSDTMSMTSQDALKPDKRRRNRVSFDDDANRMIPDPNDTARVMKSNDQSAKQAVSPTLSDGELDDTMKPRPALPSFGSVRTSTPRRNPSDTPEKFGNAVRGIPAPSYRPQQGLSSDHAVGAIFANHQKQESAPTEDVNEPLPPEVTTVEGSGHFSDEGDSSDDEHVKVNVPPVEDVTTSEAAVSRPSDPRGTLTTPENPPASMEVPDIHVLPATPGIEDVPREPMTEEVPDVHRVTVPGAWDDDVEESESVAPSRAIDTAQRAPAPSATTMVPADSESDSDDSAAFSDAAEDPSELEPFGYASLDAIVESPVVGSKGLARELTPPLSEASPDASPDTASKDADQDWSRASAYWSRQKEQMQRRESDQGAAFEPAVEPIAVPEPKKAKSVPKPRAEVADKPRSALKPSAAKTEERPRQMKSSMRGPPVEAREERPRQMKASMRGPQSENIEERPVALRKSMRSPPPDAAPPKQARQPDRAKPEQGTSMRKTMRGAPEPARQAQAPAPSARPASSAASRPRPLAPTGDSDSESSFKRRKRTPSVDSGNRYAMKRSMRSGSLDMAAERRPSSSQSTKGAGRWSLRSLSPPVQTPQSLRTSLRGIPETPTMRGPTGKGKDAKPATRFSMSGFSKGPKAAPAPAPQAKPSKPAFRSRFADSDSEEDVPTYRPTGASKSGFASRFAEDSDSDTAPPPPSLAPVRGIPLRRTSSRLSSELDDSSDDTMSRRRGGAKRDSGRSMVKPMVPSQADVEKAMAAARQNVAAMTGNQELAKAPETPKGKLVRRPTDQSDTIRTPAPAVAASTSAATAAAPSPPAADGGIARKRGLLGSIFGRKHSSSGSVKSPVKPALVRADSTPPASPSSPRTGKLQRRQRPVRTLSSQSNASATETVETPRIPTETGDTPRMAAVEEEDGTEGAWPLSPPVMPGVQEVRPASSDGVAPSRKMALEARPSSRRSKSGGLEVMTSGLGGEGSALAKGTVGGEKEKAAKKKRFGKLRRAFGLDD